MASCSDDREILLWDMTAGTAGFRHQVDSDQIPRDLAFSPGGETLASIGSGGKILLWNAASGELETELQP